MPNVGFRQIRVGDAYTRKQLAVGWGYSSFHALARGVVTPKGNNLVILFVTEQKSADRPRYEDLLSENMLHWEGPTDHFAEERMLNAPQNGDEIHAFYRVRQREAFEYLGLCDVVAAKRHKHKPSVFTLRVR